MKLNSDQLFIKHFITILKERINDLYPMSDAPNDFEAGKSMAYYEVMDLILECSNMFNIKIENKEDFMPDKLL